MLHFQLHTYWSGFSLTTIPEWDGEINNKKDARALFFIKKTSPLPGPPTSCPNTFLDWYDDTRVGIVPKLLNGELIIKSEWKHFASRLLHYITLPTYPLVWSLILAPAGILRHTYIYTWIIKTVLYFFFSPCWTFCKPMDWVGPLRGHEAGSAVWR